MVFFQLVMSCFTTGVVGSLALVFVPCWRSVRRYVFTTRPYSDQFLNSKYKAPPTADRMMPEVSIRRWILTLLWSRRVLLARNPKLYRERLGIQSGNRLTAYIEATEASAGPTACGVIPASQEE